MVSKQDIGTKYYIEGNIRPVLFLPISPTLSMWANSKLAEFKTILNLLLIKKSISIINSIVCANSRQGVNFCKCRRAKKRWGKNNPVNSIRKTDVNN